MEIVEKSENKLEIKEELDESLANALRRFVGDIPILAVDEVEIFKNDSALYDETLAHRIGLVPLKLEKSIHEREKCSCKGEGCSKCTIELKLISKKDGYVYSRELKGRAEVVYDKIPLTILHHGQEIELVAYARLGRGKEHARFSPGMITYYHAPGIKTIKELKEGQEIYSHPIQKDAKKQDMLLNDLYDEALPKDSKEWMEVEATHELIIAIESFGQISPEDILLKASKELQEQLQEFIDSLE